MAGDRCSIVDPAGKNRCFHGNRPGLFAGTADGADEKSDFRSAHGNWGDVQRRTTRSGFTKWDIFRELLASNEEVNESIRPLLRLSRYTIARLQKTERALVSSLERDPLLTERIKRLRTVSRSWAHCCTDMGSGDKRDFALPIHPTSDQLLRALR